jgi:hypothetical protein
MPENASLTPGVRFNVSLNSTFCAMPFLLKYDCVSLIEMITNFPRISPESVIRLFAVLQRSEFRMSATVL